MEIFQQKDLGVSLPALKYLDFLDKMSLIFVLLSVLIGHMVIRLEIALV